MKIQGIIDFGENGQILDALCRLVGKTEKKR